jgi:hypothetical protein
MPGFIAPHATQALGRSCREQGLTNFPQASWAVFRRFFQSREKVKKERKCNYSSNVPWKFWVGKRKQAISTTGRNQRTLGIQRDQYEEILGRKRKQTASNRYQRKRTKTAQPGLQLGVGDRSRAPVLLVRDWLPVTGLARPARCKVGVIDRLDGRVAHARTEYLNSMYAYIELMDVYNFSKKNLPSRYWVCLSSSLSSTLQRYYVSY